MLRVCAYAGGRIRLRRSRTYATRISGWQIVIVLLISGLVALVILCACLHGAPLITLMCVGLLGFAVHAGVLTLPASIRTPVAHLSSAVHEWQKQQAAALGCEVAQISALRQGSEASLDSAVQLCDSSGSSRGG